MGVRAVPGAGYPSPMARPTAAPTPRPDAPTGHRPVLLTEAVAALAPRPGGRYLDATFGGGGHAGAVLAASAPDGLVLALDADPDAVTRGPALAADPAVAGRLRVVHANFADLADVARRAGVVPLDGVLLDLGLSSFQLDAPERGFAFRFDGPLDMRFDPTGGVTASDLVATLPEADLADLFFRHGEEPRARRIAAAVVRERARAPIRSTARLAAVVEAAVGGRRGAPTHPATRTFQALRIAVNGELAALERALAGAVAVLAPGGRLAVIAFHSLEDRLVKRFVAAESAACVCPPAQPVCTCAVTPRLRKLPGGAIRPSPAEVAANPRSRSAVLRVAERLGEAGGGRREPRGARLARRGGRRP